MGCLNVSMRAAVLVCSLLILKISNSSAAQQLKCVSLPPVPLYGHFKVSGQFSVSLTCPIPGTDLPLNAPGAGGVLFCDPDEKNYEFDNVHVPDCIPLKIPDSIRVPVLLVYTLRNCSFDLVGEVIKIRNSLSQSADKICSPSQRCTWTKPQVRCDTNKMYPNNMPFQADVTFTMEALYTPQANVSAYIDEIEMHKNNMFGVNEGRDSLSLKWSVESTEINFIEIGSWTASCERFPNTIGSDLALHRVVSCRGCSVSFWFNEIRGKCQQCPFNYYTTGPYATECVVCPPDSQWGNARKTMIQLCYGRE